MSLEAEIRALHAKGYSRTEIGRALNIPFNKIKLMCEFMGDLTWPAANPGMTRRQAHERHTLRDIEGTLQELITHFGIEWTATTVSRRLREGMAIEDAFFNGRLRQPQDRMIFRGIEGTLEELMMHFGVEWKTETVRRRLNEGKSLEEALFTGRPKIRSWYRESFGSEVAATPVVNSAQRA